MKIVIIGGGPAGTSSGIALAKKGCDVTIIDKAHFPRPKLCAGILSEKTINLMNKIIPGFLDNIEKDEMEFIEIYSSDKLLDRYSLTNTTYVVNRKEFDNQLMNEYKKLGGKLIEGHKVMDISFYDKTIKLDDNNIIKYDILIGADGVHSMVRRKLGYMSKPKALCLQTSFNRNKGENCQRFIFNKVEHGYVWYLSCDDHNTIGYGCIPRKSFKFKPFMKNILNNSDYDYADKVLGAYVPMKGYIKRPIGKDSTYLIGDAAGYVDSATGEGIYFSLLSGYLTCRLIMNDDNNAIHEYELMERQIRNSYKMYYLFYTRWTHSIVMWIFENDKDFFKYIYSNIISSYNCSPIKILGLAIYAFFKILYSKIIKNNI